MTENPYQSPAEVSPSPEPIPSEADDAKLRRSAVIDGFAIQVILVLFGNVVLDGGHLFRFCLIVVVAHWIGALFILLRRRKALTWWDRLYIRFGIFPMLVIVPIIAGLVYRIFGESSLS